MCRLGVTCSTGPLGGHASSMCADAACKAIHSAACMAARAAACIAWRWRVWQQHIQARLTRAGLGGWYRQPHAQQPSADAAPDVAASGEGAGV